MVGRPGTGEVGGSAGLAPHEHRHADIWKPASQPPLPAVERASMLMEAASRLALEVAAIAQRRLSVVLFHRVLAQPDALLPDEPDREAFARQVRWLAATFRVFTAGEAGQLLRAGRLPPRSLCITFDDGYRDNAEVALPVLRQIGVPATFFVTTAYMTGGMMWNDRVIEAIRAWPQPTLDLGCVGLAGSVSLGNRSAAVSALLERLKYLPFAEREAAATALHAASGARAQRMMMDADEIALIANSGMEVGGHTCSHPILTDLADADAQREIADNKARLEAIVGKRLVTFAYPNGRPQRDYDGRHVAMLRASGYEQAFTTAPGTATAHTDLLQLPRFTPWDRGRTKYLARMLANYFGTAATVSVESA